MSQHYNQKYSRDQITKVLEVIRECIRERKFIISKNKRRQENIDFINEYNINSKMLKKILLNIKLEDFCHSLQNTKRCFEHEVLYVFCPQVILFDFDGNEESVDIYTKFNIIDTYSGKRVVVVSFHKRNKVIDYLFK